MWERRLLLLFQITFVVALSALCAIGQTQQVRSSQANAAATSSAIVLQGEVKGRQNHSYIEAPFHVPDGVRRVTLTFRYTGRDQHTALDLGVLDSEKLRCWSGGNKSVLTISTSDATPSCLAGPIPAGEWKILIGVPNIRSNVTSRYTAKVYFTRAGSTSAEPDILLAPLHAGYGWYRGDLHMHTAHSDGQCLSQSGKKVPCPVFLTVEAAAKRGLDFIAISDHNATSQYNSMRELQPYFDKVLLIPGREITTFYGHLNLIGTTAFLDFRVGSKQVPDMNTLLRRADRLGAIVSINHPNAPSGEVCLGCGWTPPTPVDMHLLQAVEAVNGGAEAEGYSNVSFWDQQLNVGYRLAGLGGSDNHNALMPLNQPNSVGSPTTVVYASELSIPAILNGIRAGHVFIDLTGSRNRILELTAHDGEKSAMMGDELAVKDGMSVEFDLHSIGSKGGQMHLMEDGHEAQLPETATITSADQVFHYTWTGDRGRHWFRAQIDGPDGKMWVLGNPIYINWMQKMSSSKGQK